MTPEVCDQVVAPLSKPGLPSRLEPVGGVVVGPVVGGVVVPEQVGSPGWGGTLTASQAALTVLNSVQLPGYRFLAAVSVQVRYFRYDELEVFSSMALYMMVMAFWMPRPVTEPPLHAVLAG